MTTLQSGPTDSLTPALIHEMRSLLDTAFGGAFTDDDWNHVINGIHVWILGSHGPVSHGSLVERTIVCSDVELRVGFVEAVATDASWRRQGHGRRVRNPRLLRDARLGTVAWADLR